MTNPPSGPEAYQKKEVPMIRKRTLAAAVAVFGFNATALPAQIGVTEINEGTVRRVYIDRPLVGAKGYVVGNWEKEEARVEVLDFPASSTGYEVFLFPIDAHAYMNKMFVDGDPAKGIVADPVPFGEVAGLISQWYSLGDLAMNDDGTGTLAYTEGANLYDTGLNMIFVFEKVTPGRHEGPEDVSKLIVECNGPLNGMPGSAEMAKAIKVFATK